MGHLCILRPELFQILSKWLDGLHDIYICLVITMKLILTTVRCYKAILKCGIKS